jgi:membrane dipeptidase
MLRYLLLLCSFYATSAVAQSFKKLHDKAIVIDTHNDVLSSVSMKGLPMDSNLRGTSHSDIHRFKEGGIDIQVFSVFCDERFGHGTAFAYANREIDSLAAVINRNPGKIMLVKDPADLKQAVRSKKIGAMIGVEGGHMIEEDLGKLQALFNRGARYLTLTWNNSVSWASSGKDETEGKVSDLSKGLNDFGKQVVQKMNELGMMVDVSHVGEQTFYDAIRISRKPVIASHSCAWTLCNHFRTLKDDQLRALAKNGGVIFVNFYSGFIDSTYMRRVAAFHGSHKSEMDSLKKLKWPFYQISEWMAQKYPEAQSLRPPLSMLIDHIDHIVKIAGINHVGIGSDFDGIESAPQGLDDVTNMPLVTKALMERGYSKRAVKKILGGNFIRVFKANSRPLSK